MRTVYQIVRDKGRESWVVPENWDRVKPGIPCPVCGKEDGCLIPAGNPPNPTACVCVWVSEGAVKELEFGWLHNLEKDNT